MNRYANLKIKGTVGKVGGTGINTITVANSMSESIAVYTAELEKGKFGSGIEINIGTLRKRVLPGEGDGWFTCERHAVLYALGYIIQLPISKDARLTVDILISRFSNLSLFGDDG